MEAAEHSITRESILRDGLTEELGRILWWNEGKDCGGIEYRPPGTALKIEFYVKLYDFAREQWDDIAPGKAVIFSTNPGLKVKPGKRPPIAKAELITKR